MTQHVICRSLSSGRGRHFIRDGGGGGGGGGGWGGRPPQGYAGSGAAWCVCVCIYVWCVGGVCVCVVHVHIHKLKHTIRNAKQVIGHTAVVCLHEFIPSGDQLASLPMTSQRCMHVYYNLLPTVSLT